MTTAALLNTAVRLICAGRLDLVPVDRAAAQLAWERGRLGLALPASAGIVQQAAFAVARATQPLPEPLGGL